LQEVWLQSITGQKGMLCYQLGWQIMFLVYKKERMLHFILLWMFLSFVFLSNNPWWEYCICVGVLFGIKSNVYCTSDVLLFLQTTEYVKPCAPNAALLVYALNYHLPIWYVLLNISPEWAHLPKKSANDLPSIPLI
jgi:hypothetical protein